MLPFVLYFATAAITGWHVYTLLLLAVYGAPFDPLELVSLLGSLSLFIAAYVSLFKPNRAARIALIASLAIWCFYGPAIAQMVRTRRAPLPVSTLIREAPVSQRKRATLPSAILQSIARPTPDLFVLNPAEAMSK